MQFPAEYTFAKCESRYETLEVDSDMYNKTLEFIFCRTCDLNAQIEIFERFIPDTPNCVPANYTDESCGYFEDFLKMNGRFQEQQYVSL